MSVNFKNAALRCKNTAAIQAAGQRKVKTVSLPLFTDENAASWAVRWLLAEASQPMATYTLSLGRKAFSLKPGDLFKLSYAPYGIEDLVVRVISIEEEALDSEKLTVTAIEDIQYAANVPSVTSAVGQAESQDVSVDALTHFRVIEPPYHKDYEMPSTVLPIPARKKGNETGALIYMSSDSGTSYTRMGAMSAFAVYGVLTSVLAAGANSFTVSITLDAGRLQSQPNAHNNETNLILIGGEIISFETITPTATATDDEYTISGLSRGMYDTDDEAHASGAAMYSLDGLDVIQNKALKPGNEYQFKAVAYNSTSVGDLSEAPVVTINPFKDRTRTPLPVINLQVNGKGFMGTYEDDIVLTWDPQVRWSTSTPASLDDCQGYFLVQVWVDGVCVRSETSLTAASPNAGFFNTYTYSEIVNLSDNTDLPDTVVFSVFNIVDPDQEEHTLPAQEILVALE